MRPQGLCSGPDFQRGSILVPVAAMLVMVAGLLSAILIETLGDRTAVMHLRSSHAALDVAETGLVRAELEIRSGVDAHDDGIGNVSGFSAGGSYEVEATQHPESLERWTLVATGSVGLSARRVEVGVRRRSVKRFVEALYARETLDFGGTSQTDAYDSRNGTHADQAVNADAGGPYAEGGGHVGSGMGIVLHGSSTHIRGNAIPGPLHTTERNGTPTVWGDMMPRRHILDLKDVPYEEFEAAHLSNNNAELVATNALGEDPETAVDSVSDTKLRGLARGQVDGLRGQDTLLITDTEMDGMTFGDLVSSDYAPLLQVEVAALAKPTDLGLATYRSIDYDVLRFSDTKLDADIALAEGTYEMPTDISTTSDAVSSGGGSGRAGRVSYDAATRELRATAGAAVVLTGGTYFFSNVKLVGRAHLVVRGPCKIYVTGELDLGGGAIFNESGKPGDLRIFGHPYPLPPGFVPTNSAIKIRGGAQVAAAVYAPGVDVTVGGGDDLYGSIVGKRIDIMGGVRFHYDRALEAEDTTPETVLERLYWRELSASPR